MNRSKRQKVNTTLDSKVLIVAKMGAAKEPKLTTGVVLQTHGMLKIDPDLLHRILDEEPGVLEV